MQAVGSADILGIDIQIPDILHQVNSALLEAGRLEDIVTETVDDDPSKLRDITDPWYCRCWWRGEVSVSGDDGYDRLATWLNVCQSSITDSILI